MKIAVYKDTVRNGRGADAAVIALADGLAERGHGAVLFTKDEPGAPAAAERRRLTSPLELASFEVIVAAGTNELLDLAPHLEALPPVVQQFHTEPAYQFKWKRFIRNARIRRALRRVARVQVLRPDLVAQVLRYAPDVPVSVIGNWSGYAGAEPRAVGTRNTVVFPGALNAEKNQSLLIRAFAAVAPEFPDWSVELYGTGKPACEAKLRALAAGLPVSFMGYRDLERAYAECAFVAFPSRKEGFPLVLADAAAHGKPALAVRDWIGLAAAGGGVVAEPSVKAYAEGLRRLMGDAPFRTACGAKARSFAAQNCARARVLDQWERLLASELRPKHTNADL